MEIRVYVVLERLPSGGDNLVAVRLTRGSAEMIRDQDPDKRRVEPFKANKEETVVPAPEEFAE